MPSPRTFVRTVFLVSIVACSFPGLGVAAFAAHLGGSATAVKTTHIATTRAASTRSTRGTVTGALANLHVSASSRTTVSLAWADSSTKSGSSYSVYVDGAAVGTTAALTFTVGKLTCSSSHVFGVAKKPSKRAELSIVSSSAPCPTSVPPAGDTQPPTVPGSLAVSQATASTVTISWEAATDDIGVVSYRTYLDGVAAGSVAGAPFAFTGLHCGTTHQVGVDAVDAAGNRSAKASISVSTSGCPDTLPPLQPVIYVTGSDAHSATITWSVPLDNVGVTGYSVSLNGTTAGTTVAPGYTFSGLTCGTVYNAGVAAYDAAGNVSPRSAMPVTTSPCGDSTPPTAPPSLHIGSVSTTSVSVAWAASADNIGVVGYRLYTDATSTGDTGTLSAVQTGLSCGTSHAISVAAYDGAGNVSQRSTVSASTASCAQADLTPPTAPAGLSVTGAGQTGLTLNWNASSDNVGVQGYNVFVNGTAAGQSSGTSYAIGGRACGTSYVLAVEATDAAGNVSQRPSITASTTACPPAGVAGGASVYLASNGNDSNSCSQSQPCASLQRGLNVAQSGQTVAIAAGSYPRQDLAGDRGGTVTFKAGGSVTFAGRLTLVNAHNVTFTGPIDFTGADQWFDLFVDSCSSNVTFNQVSGTHFGITGGSHDIAFNGGSWGNITAPDAEDTQIGGGVNRGCGPSTVKNVALNGITFHDDHWNQAQSQWGSAHPDCLQVTGDLDGLTITNSTFVRCANTFFGFYPDFGDILNVTFDHDTMTDVSNNTWWSAQLNGAGKPGVCGNFRFTNNTFQPNNPGAQTPYATLLLACPVKPGYAGALVQGNTFQMGPDSYGCSNGFAQYGDIWRSNVFTLGNSCVIG